jgi:hypothetical protein
MLLITEHNDSIELLTEKNADGTKSHFIEGIFMQSEQKNRNGRMYPKQTLMKEVARYNTEYVQKSRAMGELGHPDGPTVNLERVSHLITSLKEDGNDVRGKAKILDTPYGNIVKNLMKEGAKLGVSSRGMGSLKEKDGVNEVQGDFLLAAVDIVSDPSAPDAFVDGIMEGKEWIWDNGVLQEKQIECYKQCICRASSKRDLDEAKLKVFENFISKL